MDTIKRNGEILNEMQDSELHGNRNEQNDNFMSDLALTRRQSRSLYRNWVALSKKTFTGQSYQSQTNVFGRISTSSVCHDLDGTRSSCNTLIEERADEIVRHIEQSQTFLNDDPRSNNDRIETLRDMTEYLTLKRSVKRKLIKSIDSTSRTLSFSKRLRYSLSIFFYKIPVAIKHFMGSFELWYSSLKVIEGHFGSSVASYFQFLRKLFLLNACIFILIFFFILVPQLLFRFIQYVEDVENNNSTDTYNISSAEDDTNFRLTFLGGEAKSSPIVMFRANPYKDNDEFRLGNLFTGEGFLTNTILFYGYYSNTSLKLVQNYEYNIPVSYFFTHAVCYILTFFFLFISVAVSYRKRYIEASGGMNNTFSNKVFCGWDFGIATKQAAELKSKSIYIEIKELLDDSSKPKKRKSCISAFYTTAISFSLNGILLFFLGVGGMYSWKYLDQQMNKADTATTMMMWLVLTLVVAVAPVLFSLIAHLEGFESPSSALYMTLIRSFSLYAIVIAVVVAYRLNRSAESECWETILGQDMYRLVVLDFIFGLIGTALSEFIRFRIFVKMWKRIGCPEFDIARSTMNLIYNQTLFYFGLYFSPVLSLVITIKMFFTFYIKKWGAVYNCKPFVKPWKAAQAHTVYLSIAFFAFFCVVIAYGYIITSVKTSNCGPFGGEKFMYESLLKEMLANKDSTLLMAFYYITRPGVVGIVLMAMLLGVYYMRAVAMARIHVVNHLRHLLRLKAEERKLLLNEISKYSRNCDRDNGDDRPFTLERVEGSSLLLIGSRLANSKENSPKIRRKFDKVLENEPLSKTKFSSLTNLENRGGDRNSKFRTSRNNIFNSVQNINRFDIDEQVGFKCNRSNKSLKRSCNNLKAFDRPQATGSNYEESVVDSSLAEIFDSPIPLKSCKYDGTKLKDSVDDIINGYNAAPLNFNPIFTQSLPLESDDDDDDDDNGQNKCVKTTGKLERSLFEDGQDKVNQDEDFEVQSSCSKSYHRFEERVPSRISFESGSDKVSKKKKRR